MSELRTIVRGRLFLELPRWHDGALWVADWGAHEALKIGPRGAVEVVASTSSFPMCLDHLADGRLIVVDSAARRLASVEPDGALVTHADLSALSERRVIGNDIVVDGRDNIYVNDVNFDFPGGEPRPGWVALVKPDGRARRVAEDLMFPNGMAITPDNRTLIVAESYRRQLTAFEIAADGSLGERRVWARLDGPPDGICLDDDGCVWAAFVPNRSCMRIREGGEVTHTVETPRGAFACILGGPGRRTLYVVGQDWRGPEAIAELGATGEVWAIEAPAAAAGWP